MKIGLLQLDPTVGDFAGNVDAFAAAARTAREQGAELCIGGELGLCGYPPHDLVLHGGFLEAETAARERLVRLSGELDCGLLFGTVLRSDKPVGKPLHNAAVLCDRGEVLATKIKTLLPTYDVFDERRYFEPGPAQCVVPFRGVKLGLLICEDIWTDPDLLGRIDYEVDPAVECAQAGAELLINISASPWALMKQELREKLLASTARKTGLPVVMVNQVGANDDLIFDGGSVVVDGAGRTRLRLPLFTESCEVCDPFAVDEPREWPSDTLANTIEAITLGIRDYFRKTGFEKALLGLSGGVDSAVVACLAARALGPSNVHGISMPTRYSSEGSVADSRELAENLGIGFEVIDIDEVFEGKRRLLREPGGVAEENMQARIRGIVLMTRSNATGELVLATGNASELAVGYSTLYGDMCGALQVIGDVPKTRVFEIARRFSEMPEAIITKPPSAELRLYQKDEDTLPPYEVLDRILAAYLDERVSLDAMVERGLDRDLCEKIVRMVEIAEYKRRQAPIVLRVSKYAFGAGRKIPVAKRIGT